MSLPYYRFFPGDYARDTRHLSMLQHGAYRQLIDMYMEAGGPIPNDLPKIYRWIRAESLEEKAAVEFVLAEFFELSTGKRLGWIHKRCDKEWEWSKEKREQATESAKKRWTYERNANALQTQSEGNANQNQNYSKTKAAREKPHEGQNQPPKVAWWETDSGVEAKGIEVGVLSRPGESWQSFKDRVFAAVRTKSKA